MADRNYSVERRLRYISEFPVPFQLDSLVEQVAALSQAAGVELCQNFQTLVDGLSRIRSEIDKNE